MIKKLLLALLVFVFLPTNAQWTSFGATNRYFYGVYNGTLCTFGDTFNSGRLVPVPIDIITNPYGITDPLKFSRGNNFNVVLRLDKSLWGWGKTDYGQLGTYRANAIINPTKLNYYTWSDVAAGDSHVIAIREDGTLWGWGRNSSGEVGVGNTTAQLSPVQIGTDNDWAKVYASSSSSFGMKKNGTLWAWGYNTVGTLGDGTLVNKTTPVQIGTDKDWLSSKFVTTSAGSVFAIKGYSLYAWGRNWRTLLDATTANKTTPTVVGTNWKSVSGNLYYGMGIKNDGTLWVWGAPNGTPTYNGIDAYVPQQIGTDTDWLSLATGGNATIILKDGAEKTLWSIYTDTYGSEVPDMPNNNNLHKIEIVDPVVRTYIPGLLPNSKMFLSMKKIKDGSTSINEQSFLLSTTNRNPQTTDTNLAASAFNNYNYANCNCTISGMTPNTSYYVNSYAKNSSLGRDANGSMALGNTWGNVVEINTNKAPIISDFGDFLNWAFNNSSYGNDGVLQSATLSSDNLKQGTNVKVTMHSYSRELANVAVSSNGSVNFSIPFPNDLEPGVHTIIISGTNKYDEAFNEYLEVYVNADGMIVNTDEKLGIKYISENTKTIFNSLSVADDDPSQTVTFSIAGTEANLFTIDPSSGKLEFIQTPDFENPQDANKDNIYEVYVLATDNGSVPKSEVYLYKIKVRDVKETALLNNIQQIYLGDKILSVKASINNNGGDVITEKGYLLATGTLNANTLQEGLSGVSKGIVSASDSNDITYAINNLTPNTDYSVRFYVKNSMGISYSDVLNVHTLSETSGPKILYDSPQYFMQTTVFNLAPQNFGASVTLPTGAYGTVSSFAGSTEGDVSASTPTTSKFNAVLGLVFDADKNLYFSDQYNHKIKKITREVDGSFGPVTVLAGSTSGTIDATGTSAKFSYPAGLAYDGASAIYVADWGNGKIRKVTLAGVVSTIATGFSKPTDLLYKVESNVPYLYVADAGNHCIKKVNLTDNSVSVFAGTSGTSGTTDGAVASAKFNVPSGIAITKQGVIYVVDRGNNKIRKIENGSVSTFAGSGTAATTDGLGTAASFDDPYSVLLDGQENLYITQAPAGTYPNSNPGFSIGSTTNNYIRKITADGNVSIFAGKGNKGITNNAIPTEALLSVPTNLVIDKETNVMYVSEWMGDDIRSIQLAKGYEISPALPSPLSFNSSTGVISGRPTGEILGVDYSVKASNYYGTSSAAIKFNTITAPVVSIDLAPNSVYDTNVVLNSSVDYSGQLPILERGICWSKTNNTPTVNDDKLVIAANTSFQSTPVYGLETNTRYYTRAYVKTAMGTYYSPWVTGTENNLNFLTKILAPSFYYNSSAAYEVGANTAITPTVVGGAPALDYEIYPSLPDGLSLNPQNGQITGVPTQTVPLTTYVVKTYNAGGIAYAILNFEVVSSNSLSVKNFTDDSEVKVLNNPIINNEIKVYFKNGFSFADIDVFDAQGTLVLKRKLRPFDLSNHIYSTGFKTVSGVYFMRVITDKFTKTLKIINN